MWPPLLPLLLLPPLLALALLAAGAAACPAACSCRRDAAACDGPPADGALPGSARRVLLRHLDGGSVAELLAAGANLDSLTITQSDLSNETLEVLEPLNVTSLSLPGNGLESVPALLLNATGLVSLDLSDNAIQTVTFGRFRTLRTLQVLNVSANSVCRIDSSSFDGLTGLRYLDLSRNRLSEISPGALTPLVSLQHLNLSRNRLETLSEACLGGLRLLRQLDVSWNRLARVAVGGLELPRLARLLLAGNPRLGDARVLLGAGRRLQAVDASRSGLRRVPAALTHSIRTLRLAGNSIRRISCGDLDSYPLLQLLDFSSNELEIVEDDALGRLDSLSVLYLTDNEIREIPKSLPEKLAVLHLEHNGIRRVSREDLEGLSSLEVLLLNDNKIQTVGEGAFGATSSLVTLDLSRNPIAALQPSGLAGPMRLRVLRVASVAAPSPAREASFPLSAPEYLLSLDLSASPALARQLLADTAALAAARELQELDLSNNDLEFIRSDLLHFLPQLRSLHLNGNRLNCSDLQWLATWMRRQDESEYRDVACASPTDMWGTPIVDLQPINQVEYEVATVATTTSTTAAIEDSTNSVGSTEFTDVNNSSLPVNISELYLNANNEIAAEGGGEDGKYNKLLSTSKAIKLLNKIPGEREGKLISANITEGASANPSPISVMNNDQAPPRWRATPHGSINQPGKLAISGAPGDAPGVHLVRGAADLSVDDASSETPSQWNASVSMYTTERQGWLLHPGMLILGAAVLGPAAALALLAARFCGKRRRNAPFQQEDIEVASLPSVTELW